MQRHAAQQHNPPTPKKRKEKPTNGCAWAFGLLVSRGLPQSEPTVPMLNGQIARRTATPGPWRRQPRMCRGQTRRWSRTHPSLGGFLGTRGPLGRFYLGAHRLRWKCTDPCRKTTFLLERGLCTSMLVGGRVGAQKSFPRFPESLQPKCLLCRGLKI